MAKIIYRTSKRVVYEDEEWNCYDIVTSYFDLYDINYEMKFIPSVEKCHEECAFLHVWDDDTWFILGWDCEENCPLWTKILQFYFPRLEVAV